MANQPAQRKCLPLYCTTCGQPKTHRWARECEREGCEGRIFIPLFSYLGWHAALGSGVKIDNRRFLRSLRIRPE